MKNIILAVLFLAIGLLGSIALAQQTQNTDLTQPFEYDGIETSVGTHDPECGILFGNSFTFTSFEPRETRILNVSLNYLTPLSLPSGGADTGVTGGTWSLVVFKRNTYFGTIYGDIQSGSILFPDNIGAAEHNAKQSHVKLVIKGGLGDFEGINNKQFGDFHFTTSLSTRESYGSLSLKLKDKTFF